MPLLGTRAAASARGFGFGGSRAFLVVCDILGADVSIPTSTNGARVGDLVIIFSPYPNSGFTPGGSGWTSWSDSYYGAAYGTVGMWKVLTATTDITMSGNLVGCIYAVWRRASSVSRVAFNSNVAALAVPAPAASVKGQMLLVSRQSNNTSAPLTPTGYTADAFDRPNIFPMASFSRSKSLFTGTATIGPNGSGEWLAANEQQLTAIEVS
jgi:hypothetical protein